MKKIPTSEYIYLVLGWTVYVLFSLAFMPFFTIQYRGIGADSKEQIYIQEHGVVGVYVNGKRISEVSLDEAHVRYGVGHQFLMRDEKIFISKSGTEPFDVLDLEGNWLGYSEPKQLASWEMNEYEMENGDVLVLKNRPLLPARAVRYRTDGTEEIVFREPLFQYGLKLSIPVVWAAYIIWQIHESQKKKREWKARLAAVQERNSFNMNGS